MNTESCRRPNSVSGIISSRLLNSAHTVLDVPHTSWMNFQGWPKNVLSCFKVGLSQPLTLGPNLRTWPPDWLRNGVAVQRNSKRHPGWGLSFWDTKFGDRCSKAMQFQKGCIVLQGLILSRWNKGKWNSLSFRMSQNLPVLHILDTTKSRSHPSTMISWVIVAVLKCFRITQH